MKIHVIKSGEDFSTIAREKELEALLSPSFQKAVRRNGVNLISFREALS